MGVDCTDIETAEGSVDGIPGMKKC